MSSIKCSPNPPRQISTLFRQTRNMIIKGAVTRHIYIPRSRTFLDGYTISMFGLVYILEPHGAI